MKDITKQTTIAGVKKCVQSLSDRIDRQLGEINERYDGIGRRLNKLSRIEKQENCDHQYLRIEIENDANCAALAEARFGIKKKNFLVLTLGTGIGGGIIINGELYKGRSSAGEFWEMIINQGKGFEYYYKKSKNNKEKLADILGQGIASLISVLDPEAIVLTGGMRNLGKSFLNNIKKETKKYIPQNRIPKIMWSNIKYPSLIGASLLFK